MSGSTIGAGECELADDPRLSPPEGPAGLSVEWLGQVLAQNEAFAGTQLLGLSWERISEGRGFVGEVVRVRLRLADEASAAPSSVVVKFAGDSGLLKLVELGDLYRSEKLFYSELQETSPMGSPACYYVHHDPDEGRFVLVLEDLAHCEPGDQVRGTTDERAALAVTELARQHAYWWNHPRLRQIRRTGTELNMDLVRARYAEGMGMARSIFGERHPAFFRAAAEFGRLLATEGIDFNGLGPGELKEPFTLLHGDYRLDNMFFSSDAARPLVVVDWTAAVGPGFSDLLYFLSSSLLPEQHARLGPALVDLYIRTLEQHGVTGVTTRQFRKAYTSHLLSEVPKPIVGLTFTSDGRGRELMKAGVERLDAMLQRRRGFVWILRLFRIALGLQSRWRRLRGS